MKIFYLKFYWLSDSDIKCTFVQTGFPQNRSRYLRRVVEKAGEDLDDEEGDIEEQIVKATESALTHITIPGVKGKFVDPPSIHEKYASRPKSLEHLSLAQFVISYVSGT